VALSFRRQPEPPRWPRPNYTTIAVLEHDLLGIQPEPGTVAAVTIALRKVAANCTAHQPVETPTFAQPGRVGMCARCGCDMALDAGGEWVRT
jgi:hypothetical protein